MNCYLKFWLWQNYIPNYWKLPKYQNLCKFLKILKNSEFVRIIPKILIFEWILPEILIVVHCDRIIFNITEKLSKYHNLGKFLKISQILTVTEGLIKCIHYPWGSYEMYLWGDTNWFSLNFCIHSYQHQHVVVLNRPTIIYNMWWYKSDHIVNY